MDDEVTAFITRYEAMGLQGTSASLEDVSALEKQLLVTFPAAYKAFLLILGRDGGSDFIGSDCTTRHLPGLRESAEGLLRECGSPFALPDAAVVFLMHQGCYFCYFVADGMDDPPVFAYREGDASPGQKAESFSQWLAL